MIAIYSGRCKQGLLQYTLGHLIIEEDKYFIKDLKTLVQEEVVYETIGQYIGVNDKNSRYLFEKDIVRRPNGEIGTIVFENGTYTLDRSIVDQECEQVDWPSELFKDVIYIEHSSGSTGYEELKQKPFNIVRSSSKSTEFKEKLDKKDSEVCTYHKLNHLCYYSLPDLTCGKLACLWERAKPSRTLNSSNAITSNVVKTTPHTCQIMGCSNKSDQGKFIGELCAPCFKTLQGDYSSNSAARELIENLEYCKSIVEVHLYKKNKE